MQYKHFKDTSLSRIGFGAMRFPLQTGGYGTERCPTDPVDMEKTREMITYAMDHGINYYDTAYGFHAGKSEEILADALAPYARDSYYLATKYPGFNLKYFGHHQKIFPEQLSRLKTDYIDFYLLHNVNEANVDAYTDSSIGTIEYILEQKKEGRIRHLGFSAHGGVETLKKFLERVGEHMEFGQIQLNWMDWELQDAKKKVELLTSYGISIWTMESLRGGKLANLSPEHMSILNAYRPGKSAAEWGMRFLETIPEVGMILSGMSTLEQVKENVAIFEKEAPLSKEEWVVLENIAQDMTPMTVPCTGCGYCVSECPVGINIPWMLKNYNEHKYAGGGWLAPRAVNNTPEGKRPIDCLSCGACEAVCPQKIKISEAMADFARICIL